MSLATTGFELLTKRTRKREFLDEMELVIPWLELVWLIALHAASGKTARPPFDTEVIQRGLLRKAGTVVDAILIAAPSSTKNSTGERDPEMHQTKKGNQ